MVTFDTCRRCDGLRMPYHAAVYPGGRVEHRCECVNLNKRQADALRRAERAWPGHHGSSIGIARDPGNTPQHLRGLVQSFLDGSADRDTTGG